jgi:glycine betaine/proline transport system ATP-binding protein
MRLGDRIAVMRDGQIVQIGTAEDILVTPANDYVASFTQDVDRSRVLTAGAIMSDPDEVLGTTADDGTTLRTEQDVLAAAPATVGTDTPIVELFTPCSRSGTAVAVTDGDGVLVGVIGRARLLAVLGDGDTGGDGATPPSPGDGDAPESAKKVITGA